MGTRTEKHLESLAETAANKAIKSARLSENVDEGFNHLSQLDADDGIDHESEGDKVTNFDIFDHCEELCADGKHQIKYEIKKNGEMLTTRYHPYSWERLQKDYKGGHYQVSAKSLTTKRFVKHETRSIAEPEERRRDDDDVDTRHTVQQTAPQGPSFMELFALMNGQSEKQQALARETQREAQNANQGTMLAFVEMMKSSQAQSQTMFMEIAKMTQAVSEKLAESQRIMSEKMESRFEKIVEKLTEKKEDKGMSITDLLTLQNQAQEKGFSLFTKMANLAEAKTEQRLAEIEDAREEREERRGEGKKSLTDSLIESVLPTVATALAGQVAASQAQPQQVHAARRVLPQVRTNPQRAAQASQSRTRNQNNQGQARATPIRQTVEVESTRSGSTVGTDSGASDLGLPSVNFGGDVPLTPTNTSSVTKLTIENILTPIFGTCLLERKESNLAAVEITAALNQNGIDSSTFLRTVSKDDMMGIVKGYDLPLEATPWFEEIYAHIQSSAGDVARERAAS